MSDTLAIYLHDHLAGSKFAIELLEKLKAEFSSSETGRVAADVLAEVEADRRTLEEIIAGVGKTSFDLYDAIGWFTERASRMKLKHDDPVGIGAFEAFEALALGILGKRALWEVLSIHATDDTRLRGPNYLALIERAQRQFQTLNEYRLRLARTAFVEQVGEAKQLTH